MKEAENSQDSQGFSWRRLLPLAILVGLLGLALSLGWHRYLSLDALHAHREDLVALVQAYGVWAGLGLLVIYAVATACSIPGGLVLTVGAGFLFGALTATIWVVVGATLGATVIFLAARSAMGGALRKRAGPFLRKMEAGFQANELNYLLVLRLIPLFPFWLVNIVPAFLGVSLRTYIIGTFIGIIPGTFVFASVGGTLGGILDAYDPAAPPDIAAIIFEPQNIVPIAGLIILALLPVAYKKFKSGKEA